MKADFDLSLLKSRFTAARLITGPERSQVREIKRLLIHCMFNIGTIFRALFNYSHKTTSVVNVCVCVSHGKDIADN